MSESNRPSAKRNLTLDFFRGVALIIIFINHVPTNELLLFTPSRFGLSDAAEMFVYLSGYAAAIAYGNSFRTVGFTLGSLRVFHRCGQLYAAHLGLFGLMAMICVLGNGIFDTRDYIDRLNIRYFFDDTEAALRALISLRYVPNYFDILPMYLVILLWIPAVLAISRLHVVLGMAFPVGVYVAMWAFELEFSADPHGERPWYFNPFGWQLLFFIGFAFGSGWLKLPPPRNGLLALSLLVVIASLPLSPEPGLRPTPLLQDLHASLLPWLEKTRFGPLRLVHFLALAYLGSVFFASREHWLATRFARAIIRMGQQSLPVFLVSMALSYLGLMAFDQFGHGVLSIVTINAVGIAILMLWGTAFAWMKSKPWKIPSINGTAGDAENAYQPPSPLRWRHWAEGIATVTVVALVSVGPLLLSTRKAIESTPSAITFSGNAWAINAAVLIEETEPSVVQDDDRLSFGIRF